MTLPARPHPPASNNWRGGLDPQRLADSNINPSTGLATDFLNHFNEAIMLLEMMPTVPHCKADFLAWRPMTYHEHFAASRLKHRDLAIAAYEAAEPAVRARLDAIADSMNRILITTRDGMKESLSPQTAADLALEVAWRLKPMVARAAALINDEPGDVKAQATMQAAVDALFDGELSAALGD